MKRSTLLLSALALAASVALSAPHPAQAALGDRSYIVAYSRIAHKTWVTLYKLGTFGNRTIVGSGWMPSGGSWSHEIVTGNTYYFRAQVVDGSGTTIADTTVERDDKGPSSATLHYEHGNYFWR
jgi:hypothetical protein